MKNIFRVTLLTALACLLCFSCTNINDPEALTADKFTVNKMKVEGFLLEGLNAVYDSCDFTLIREEIVTTTIKDTSLADDKQPKVDPVTNKIELGTGTVADVASLYKSGATYVKLDKPVIIEDKPATVKTEGTRTTTVGYSYSFYLTAEIDTDVFVKIQVLDKKLVAKNSELAIIPSAYGTKDENLVSKMMVVKATDVKAENFIPATFAWEDATNIEKPVVRFYIIGDLPGVTKWSWDDSDKLLMTAKSATEQEWTYKATETKTIEFKFTNAPRWDPQPTINAGAASEADGVQDVKLGTAYTMLVDKDSKNLKLAVTKDKEYVFILNVADTSNPTVTVTEK